MKILSLLTRPQLVINMYLFKCLSSDEHNRKYFKEMVDNATSVQHSSKYQDNIFI